MAEAPIPVQLALEALKILAAEDAALAAESRRKLPGFALRLAATGEEVTVEKLLAAARAREIERVPEPRQQQKTYQEIVAGFTTALPAGDMTVAAETSPQDIAQYLAGKKYNKWDEFSTPLNEAAKDGRLDAVKYLMEKRGDASEVEIADRNIKRAFSSAVANNDLEMVKYFANEVLPDECTQDILIVAHYAAELGLLNVLKYLLERYHIEGNAHEGYADGLLHTAARCGRSDIVKYLIKKFNQQISFNGIDGAFVAAAGQGHSDIAKYLAEECLPEEDRQKLSAQRAADYAAHAGHLEAVKYLVEKCGAKVATIFFNRSVVDIAIYKFDLPLLEYCVEKCGFIFSRKKAKEALAIALGNFYSLPKNQEQLDIAKYLLRKCGASLGMMKDAPYMRAARQGLEAYLDACETWQRVAHADPSLALSKQDPLLFKPVAYRAIMDILNSEVGPEQALHMELMAFHAAGLFGTEDRVLQYLEKWGSAGKQPLHDLIHMIELPKTRTAEMDLKAWGDAVLKCGPSMAKLVKLADKLPAPEKSDDGKTWSMRKTREVMAQFTYARAAENPALAVLCFENDVGEHRFDKALEIAKKVPPVKNIPDIILDGAAFDMPGAKFARLAANDVRGLFLGELTDCCQSVGGAGAKCAEHGFTSENSGFYVVENAKGKVVGQTWAWRGKKGELVFDSLETLGKNVNAGQWRKLTEIFAQTLAKNPQDVTAFHVGKGGATPHSMLKAFNEAASPAKPVGYDGYRDSREQVIIWQKKAGMKHG